MRDQNQMKTPEPGSGTLWVVATPLGNLDDLSPRARTILADVPVIAAEDTRTSRRLLPARQQPARWVSLHEHNERQTASRLITTLQSGTDVALLSDAGTPLVSDPGYRLVDLAHAGGVKVSPVPGPCAAIAALSAAGLPSDRFCFEGFLPARAGPRRRRLAELSTFEATVIVYAPARDLDKLLEEARHEFGDQRLACIAREMTKQFETIRRAPLSDLSDWVGADPDQLRGEAVVLIAADPAAKPTQPDTGLLARALIAELPSARAAKVLAKATGMDRRDAFAAIEKLKET